MYKTCRSFKNAFNVKIYIKRTVRKTVCYIKNENLYSEHRLLFKT